MTKLLLAAATITVLLGASSPTWAVQDYDRPYMYCPQGTKWYGWRVLRDIRDCDGSGWRQAKAKAKNGRK
jgi:hypothetical protein